MAPFRPPDPPPFMQMPFLCTDTCGVRADMACKRFQVCPEGARPPWELWEVHRLETQKCRVTMNVNERTVSEEVEPRLLLVHMLRDTLGLTGTHIGCDTSQCGACTVLLNGDAVKSCTVLAVQADGRQVTTVEGLGDIDRLHPMQQGFWEQHGLQCGYCTPGVMMAAVGLLQQNPNPSEAEIREGLEGVICRCTGYQNIVRAVKMAAQLMQAEAQEAQVAAATSLTEGGR